MGKFIPSLLTILFLAPSLLLAQPAKKGQYLFFEGEGKASPTIQNSTQRRSLSQEAAILDAKSKIAFYIDELKTKEQIPFKEEIAKSKAVEKRVKMFIQGVQTTKSKWDKEDHCTVVVKIHKKIC